MTTQHHILLSKSKKVPVKPALKHDTASIRCQRLHLRLLDYMRLRWIWVLILYWVIEPVVLAAPFAPIPVTIINTSGQPCSADDALSYGNGKQTRYTAARPASKPWRIAYLFPHMKDPYWTGCSYGVISEAQRLGIQADILPANGYDDLFGQMRKMDEAIAAHYDAIVISPISMTGNNPSIAHARAMGIPVFELANDSTSPNLVVKVTTSLKAMGLDATHWVINDARKRGLKSVNIVLLPGPADAGWVKGEVEGTKLAIKSAPIPVNILGILYGDSDHIVQSRLSAELLATYGKKIDYILGCSGCAPAAWLPVNEAGLDHKITIVAYDLTDEIAQFIRQKKIAAAADTKGVSQARIVTDVVVRYLEQRNSATPTPHHPPRQAWQHTPDATHETAQPLATDHSAVCPKVILVNLGMIDAAHWATYPYDTSIAPQSYQPMLSWQPDKRQVSP